MSKAETIIAIIGLVLASSVLSAVINQIGEGIRQKRKHDFDKEDKADKDEDAIKTGLKWVLFSIIVDKGLKYIAVGEIDLDDRRIIGEMHKAYHDGLGGNGDLDKLMQAVNELPLKL